MRLLYKVLGIVFFWSYLREWKEFEEKTIIAALNKQIKAWNRTARDKRQVIESIEEFKQKIPILNKSEYKANPSSFLSRKPSLMDIAWYTSGSLASPTKYWVDWRQSIMEQAVVYRHWRWHGYKFRDVGAVLRSYSPKKGESPIKYSWFLNVFFYSPFHLDDYHMEKFYRHMIKKRVKYLRGYPSSIRIFADFCKRMSYTLPNLKFILTASEVLSDDDRVCIEEVFGVRIGNHYGLAEQIVMFGNCGNSTILHNYSDYGFCELIATDQENIYRIIGTNLNNKLMPLLRYDTGDLAFVRSNIKCSCGRNGLQVEAVIGRHDQLLIDSTGLKMPTVNFYTLMEYFTDLLGWQLVQNDDYLTVLCVGKELDSIRERQIELEISEGLNSRLQNSSFNYKVKFVKSLVKIKGGKTPILVKDVQI